MEIRALLSVTVILLGIITHIIKSWINEVKSELKEVKDNQHKMDISLTKLQTSFDIKGKEGE